MSAQTVKLFTDHADPTLLQQAASDPAASVWVQASAGSGKTTVLTARVTRLLLAGVAPQKILCLTYTRAGAAEMANRILAQFKGWATCGEDELRADFDRLQGAPPSPAQLRKARQLFATVLACPGGLRIRTIHAFCQEILSRFPVEAGLPPHFALIDDSEQKILRDRVIGDLLTEAAAQPGTPLAGALDVLIEKQGEHGFDDALQDAAKAAPQIADALDRYGDSGTVIAQMRDYLGLMPGETVESVRHAAMQALPRDAIRQLATWLREGTPSHAARGASLLAVLDLVPGEADFDAYRAVFLTADNTPRAKFGDAKLLKTYPAVQDISAQEAARLVEATARLDNAGIAAHTESVLIFGQAFIERLAARKRTRAALDYDDLIAMTRALLRRPGIAPWILYKLDRGIDHILVDEAQDTSRAQWDIVEALTEEFHAGEGARADVARTVFVVGDEKQSIFSFQNADPEAFIAKRLDFERRLRAAGRQLLPVPLHTSFRSAPAILSAVDAIFADEAVRAGVSQDPVHHRAAPDRQGREKIGRVDIWPLILPDASTPDDAPEWAMPVTIEADRDPQVELADAIARRIGAWIATGERLPGGDRRIAPGDIMILLRRRGRFADLMVRALKAQRIAVTGVDRMRLMQQLPVLDLLAALRFVLLPDDDLNLAVLLKTPLLGLDDDALMDLAIGRGDASLWQALKTRSAGPATTPYAAVRRYLDALLAEADYTTPFDFLSRLLNRPCPGHALSGRKAIWARLGDEAQDPIDELLNAAQHFTAGHAPSLENFLRWLRTTDAEIKREMDSGDSGAGGAGGQVRIMTVHAAKGLEAPIVFLPDTTGLPRSQDVPNFQWTADGLPLYLARRPAGGPALRVWQRARDRQLEEYRRLLYVALTRAARQLYICGWQPKRQEGDAAASWYALARAGLGPLHQPYAAADAAPDAAPDAWPRADIMYADQPLTPPPLAMPAEAGRAVPSPPLPVWATGPAPRMAPVIVPPAASAAPLDPIAAAAPDSAFARGRIIHRLLQSLPEIAPVSRGAAVARFLAQPRYALPVAAQEEIAHEVGRLLDDPQFAPLFGPDSVAEVAVTGQIGGAIVFRQIDRLCLRGDEVWIVDYKTNRPPPRDASGIPDAYRQQLREYSALVGSVYAGKRVRSFLLWTYAPQLMEVGGRDE